MTGRLEGRVVVVTGGGSGIGRAIAQAVPVEGARVVIADRDGKAAQATLEAIEHNGGVGVAVAVDVTRRAQVREMVRAAVQSFGRIDVSFNMAGVNYPARFLEVDEDNYASIMNVNAWGVFLCMQEVAKQMIAQGDGGKIINVASTAGRQALADSAPYSASKAAVMSFVQAGARSLAEHGITVNSFAPGVVMTPMIDQCAEEFAQMDPTGSTSVQDVLNSLGAGVLLGRPAQPTDLLGLALFLASSDSDYMTGQTIQIDGGSILV